MNIPPHIKVSNNFEIMGLKKLDQLSHNSVGDIFVNEEGDCFICDTFGFVGVGFYKMAA